MTHAAPDQGLSLMDIAPVHELVPVGNAKLRVYGVSAEGVLPLFKRFPELQRWFSGHKPDPRTLMVNAPGAMAAIIAAGCGFPDNEEAEKRAAAIAIESQLDVIEVIWRLTFKNGFGPFAKRVMALAGKVPSENSGKGPHTKSPQESST